MENRRGLYMAKYVLWYVIFHIGINDILFDLPPWVYESLFENRLVYHPFVSNCLILLCAALTAGVTGAVFAERRRVIPSSFEARTLSFFSVMIALLLFAFSHYLATTLYADIGDDTAAIEKYVERPDTLNALSVILLTFCLLIQYWLVGSYFKKGAKFYLLHWDKRDNKEKS